MRIILTETEFKVSGGLLEGLSRQLITLVPSSSQQLLRDAFGAYIEGGLHIEDLLDQLPVSPHYEIYTIGYDNAEPDICLSIYDESFLALVSGLMAHGPGIVNGFVAFCLSLRTLGVNVMQAVAHTATLLRQSLSS